MGQMKNLTQSSIVGDQEGPEINLLGNHDMPVDTDGNPPLTRSQLIQDQQADPALVTLSRTSITEEEAQDHHPSLKKKHNTTQCAILKELVF